MAEKGFTLDLATWHRAYTNGDDDALGPLSFPAPCDDIVMLLERVRFSSRISRHSRESQRAARLVLHWWRLAVETAAYIDS